MLTCRKPFPTMPFMAGILSSVGRGGVNNASDVRVVQALLNKTIQDPSRQLSPSGSLDARTISAIEDFQRRVVGLVHVDGRVDPGGRTFRALSQSASGEAAGSTDLPRPCGGASLTEADFARAATALDCEAAAIKAVTEVESGPSGFFPSGRPKILFEAHVFSGQTGHRYDSSHSDISSLKWNRSLYRGGEAEYERLLKGMALDRAAALKSASWGRFQIMGFNHVAAGFRSIELFVQAMYQSEGRQIDAFVSFLQNSHLAAALRNKQWADFARGYNGQGYAANQYDTKLKQAYEKYARSS